MQYQEFNSR